MKVLKISKHETLIIRENKPFVILNGILGWIEFWSKEWEFLGYRKMKWKNLKNIIGSM